MRVRDVEGAPSARAAVLGALRVATAAGDVEAIMALSAALAKIAGNGA
jgi:hypothetical protein